MGLVVLISMLLVLRGLQILLLRALSWQLQKLCSRR